MGQVVIGMDPHNHSATIEVMAGDESVLGGGRYATGAAGYRMMLAAARRWPERSWAIEGCQGIGRHIASRLLADGRAGRGCAAQAVRPHPRVCHWPGPQDRRHRRALGRAGRDPHDRAAPRRR